MLYYRPIDIKKDKKIILELQCRINYECESPYFQDKSYEKYRKKWFASGQTKEFLSRLRKSMKEKRTIAVMVEENKEIVGYMWVQFFDVIGYDITYTEISELAVVPKYQRKGIASRMIKYIEDISSHRPVPGPLPVRADQPVVLLPLPHHRGNGRPHRRGHRDSGCDYRI